MKNRKSILLVVLLLAVGFAAVSTTLYINGSTNINPNQDDFNVYYSDAYVNGTKDLSVIKDDTVIEFTTTFEKLNQEYVLDYEVTNGSKNYDAELVMSCTSGNDYLTVTNEFDDETILEARESRLGKLTLVQTKSYAGSDDLEVTIKCIIDANALERTSLNESEIQTAGDYVIEGYYKDSNNNVLANANLVIFSDTPHYTTTDETGYVFYNGLERGKHEVYYVDDTLDNIKSMTKEEIISNAKTSAIFITTSDEIIFDDSTTIVDLKIEESVKYCSSLINQEWNFSYTGSENSFITRCSGTYKVELWGASGGSNGVTSGGTGAYVSGDLKVLANDKLYVYVGQKGPDGSKKKNYVPDSAFNGGGHGNNTPNSLPIDNSPYVSGSGGGATDIRLVNGAWNSFDSLKSRIMVAGAGGGFGYTGSAGVGGTLSGGNSSNSSGSYGGVLGVKGGTQISKGLTSTGTTTGNSNWSMGTHGGFGYGGYGVLLTHPGGGGGAGYYGGGAGGSGGGSIGGASGAGGSSFISGHTGCDAIDETSTSSNIIHTGQANHYSGLVFTNTKMLAGNEVMPSHDGTTTMTGNTGNGYAKITYLGTN